MHRFCTLLPRCERPTLNPCLKHVSEAAGKRSSAQVLECERRGNPLPANCGGVEKPAPIAHFREIHRISRPIFYHLSCNVPKTGVFAKTTQHLVLYT
jgi:hypothetical protein